MKRPYLIAYLVIRPGMGIVGGGDATGSITGSISEEAITKLKTSLRLPGMRPGDLIAITNLIPLDTEASAEQKDKVLRQRLTDLARSLKNDDVPHARTGTSWAAREIENLLNGTSGQES